MKMFSKGNGAGPNAPAPDGFLLFRVYSQIPAPAYMFLPGTR